MIKEKMNKILSLALCLLICTAVFADCTIAATAATTDDGIISYDVKTDTIILDGQEVKTKCALVTRYRGLDTDVTIPDTLGGYPVSSVKLNLLNDDSINEDYMYITTLRVPKTAHTVSVSGLCLEDIYWDIPDENLSSDCLRNHAGIKFHLSDSVSYTCETPEKYTAEVRKNYARIYKYAGKEKAVVVPSAIGGKKVKYIEQATFQDNKTMTSVVFPEGVDYVYSFAFSGCSKLKTVKLPSTVTFVSNAAFRESAITDVYYASTNNKWIKATSYNSMNGTVISSFGDIILHFTDWTVKNVTTDNGFKASLYKNFAIVYGYTGKSNKMTVPAKISKKPVQQVESSTFSNKDATSITISEGIKSAAVRFFNHNNNSVVLRIPSTVEYLDLAGTSTYVKKIYFNGTKAKYARLLKLYQLPENVVFLKTVTDKTVTLKAIDNSVKGPKITWAKLDGADIYRVYRKTADGWTLLGKTEKTSYIDSTAKAGKTYTYTVKAESSYKYTSTPIAEYSKYNKTGISIKYLAAPKISSVASSTKGLKIKWNKVAGAAGYYVYRKTADGWEKIGTTSDLAFTDKTVKNNKKYTYTVRAYKGKTRSGYISAGKSGIFLKAPVISKLKNHDNGVHIEWTKISRATSYNVYRKTTGDWVKLGKTADNKFKDKTAKPGVTYTYTVKALNEDTASAYYSDKKIKRLETPELLKLTATKGKNTLTFNSVKGASEYYIYRKLNNGEWEKIAETDALKYVDKSIKKGVTYTYTVVAVSGSSKSASSSAGLTIKAK